VITLFEVLLRFGVTHAPVSWRRYRNDVAKNSGASRTTRRQKSTAKSWQAKQAVSGHPLKTFSGPKANIRFRISPATVPLLLHSPRFHLASHPTLGRSLVPRTPSARSQSMTITSSFKESLRLGLFFFTGFSSKKITSSSSISPRSCFTPDTLSSTFTPDSWYFSRSFFTSRASASSFWGLLAPNCTRLHIKLHNRHKCLYSVPGIRKMGLYTLTLRRFSSLRSSVGSKDSVRRSQEKLD
jgi:hypothetical protein